MRILGLLLAWLVFFQCWVVVPSLSWLHKRPRKVSWSLTSTIAERNTKRTNLCNTSVEWMSLIKRKLWTRELLLQATQSSTITLTSIQWAFHRTLKRFNQLGLRILEHHRIKGLEERRSHLVDTHLLLVKVIKTLIKTWDRRDLPNLRISEVSGELLMKKPVWIELTLI